MALFRRNKKESVLPELDKYYDGERRDRTGLAWLLALISVIVIALIIIGVFLSGRWLYRELTSDDSGNDQVAVEETVPSFDGGSTDGTQGTVDDNNDQDNTESEDEAAPQEDESQTGQENGEGVVDAPARTDVPSTPQTGDSGALPNTGPANLATIFLGTSTIAGGAHYVITRKRLTSKK